MTATVHVNGAAHALPGPTPPFQLQPIAPTAYELDKVWDFVRLGIEQVLSKSHLAGLRCPAGCLEREHLLYNYRPEDVYLALRLQRAALYLTYWLRDLAGFGICQQILKTDENEPPHLLAWIGWADSQYPQVRRAYFEALESIARGLNLKEIRVCSTRLGWLRHPPTEKWETATRRGWLKHPLSPEIIRGLAAAPCFWLRRVL